MSPRISAQTSVGAVALTVGDLAAEREFYERVVGLVAIEAGERRAVLGAGGRPLVELVEDRAAPPPPPRSSGLFHLAILVPDRAELARSLQRLIETRWPLQGASDHLVSEALYVGDPEGNGIEIYRDRPRDEWQRDGDEIRMATLPLDLDDVLAEVGGEKGSLGPLPSGTRMGHVHLNVADLAASSRPAIRRETGCASSSRTERRTRRRRGPQRRVLPSRLATASRRFDDFGQTALSSIEAVIGSQSIRSRVPPSACRPSRAASPMQRAGP